MPRDARQRLGSRHAEGQGKGLHGDDIRRRAVVRQVRIAGEHRRGRAYRMGYVSAASHGRGVRQQQDADRPTHGPQGQERAAIHPLHRHAQLRELGHHHLRERAWQGGIRKVW